MTGPRRFKRCENDFRREVLAHLTDRPAPCLDSSEPLSISGWGGAGVGLSKPRTVLGYLRSECRNDVDGRKATRDVFSLRWPLFAREIETGCSASRLLLTAGLSIADADAYEADMTRELQECA